MIDFSLDGELNVGAAANALLSNVRLSWAIAKNSWWADPEFGHRFAEVQKCLPRYEALTVEYARQAIQWLFNNGRLSAAELVATVDRDHHRMILTGTLTAANGEQIPFEHFVEVA